MGWDAEGFSAYKYFFFMAHGSITLDNILTNARVLETCMSVYMHLIFI